MEEEKKEKKIQRKEVREREEVRRKEERKKIKEKEMEGSIEECWIIIASLKGREIGGRKREGRK